jgi:hypothetical protein
MCWGSFLVGLAAGAICLIIWAVMIGAGEQAPHDRSHFSTAHEPEKEA